MLVYRYTLLLTTQLNANENDKMILKFQFLSILAQIVKCLLNA